MNTRTGTALLGAESALEFSWVDVSSQDPDNFVWLRHPGGVCGEWTNRRLGEHASRLHREAIARDYLLCKTFERPAYVEIRQHIMGVTRKYRRLAVPVKEGSRVTKIAYAHCPLGASVPYPGSCEVIRFDRATPTRNPAAPCHWQDKDRTSVD